MGASAPQYTGLTIPGPFFVHDVLSTEYFADDSFGFGIYHNGISQPLKTDIARLTDATVTLENEQGLEVFYDIAITPAIRLIPSYQHIWHPMTARVVTNERGADVFLLRSSVTW